MGWWQVFAGLLVGAMLPYWFSAMTMKSVGKAALAMVEEVRRQFNTISGLMEGTARPDYVRCVEISTQARMLSGAAPCMTAHPCGSPAVCNMQVTNFSIVPTMMVSAPCSSTLTHARFMRPSALIALLKGIFETLINFASRPVSMQGPCMDSCADQG